MALRPAAVEVHGRLRRRAEPTQGFQRPGDQDLVDHAGVPGQGRHRRRAGQDPVLVRKCVGQGPQRRQPGQQVPEPEGPEGQEPQGQEGSVEGVITDSRTSQPGGWRRANSTAAATSSGG
jgi:hypothetical protein